MLRDPKGRVLLCELSYSGWDLPGGDYLDVDPGESPATCVEREIFEELGLTVKVGRLLAVNWLTVAQVGRRAPVPVRPGGPHAGELDPALFLRREIAGAHWRASRMPPRRRAVHRTHAVAADAEHPLYLENSEYREDQMKIPDDESRLALAFLGAVVLVSAGILGWIVVSAFAG